MEGERVLEAFWRFLFSKNISYVLMMMESFIGNV